MDCKNCIWVVLDSRGEDVACRNDGDCPDDDDCTVDDGCPIGDEMAAAYEWSCEPSDPLDKPATEITVWDVYSPSELL